MNKLNKFYKIIAIILIIISILLCSNKILAAENWDDFYLRFIEELTAQGNTDNLSDADLDRMIAGPTLDERAYGIAYSDLVALEFPQQKAREIKEARAQGGGKKPNDTGETNEEKKEKSKQLRKEIADFCSRDLKKETTDSIKGCLNKINTYKIRYLGEMDEIMMQYWTQLNSELDRREEEQDTTIIDNQVGNDGEIKNGNEKGSGTGTGTGSGTSSVTSTVVSPIENPDWYKPNSNSESDNTKFIAIGNVIIGIIRVLGSATAVIALVVLGVRYMLGSASDKALYKETMGPYLIGAVMVFIIPNIIGILYDIIVNNIKF